MPKLAEHRVYLESQWRREVLRTNLWLVPTLEVALAVALFFVTRAVDMAAYQGRLTLPPWVISGSSDAARQILAALAAAVITVVGVVFSIMIVTLTLASTQFGPRMLRNFIRDRATQITLGTFVATFVYAILALVAIEPGPHGDFVPHLTITVTLGLTVADVGLLIYFIHHIATTIQLPQVIASIAGDLTGAIATERAISAENAERPRHGAELPELLDRLKHSGAVVPAPSSGYLQFIRLRALVRVAGELDAVISLHYRPGHFLVQGRPIATVWPAEAAPAISASFARAHLTGPVRTLTQDISFAVDQLVEIAIRALSPAVNDTFTALTCVDWLGDCLSKIAGNWQPTEVHRDSVGDIRLITEPVRFDRLVERAFEKVRQASRGMPAVMIRQLDALAVILAETAPGDERRVLFAQAVMIERASSESVPEPLDRADVTRRYEAIVASCEVG
jgi:uncharacterized membrane protein